MIYLFERVGHQRYRLSRELKPNEMAVWPESVAIQTGAVFGSIETIVTVYPGYCNILTVKESATMQVINTRTKVKQ